ncbi:hypothetical protein [Lysinibacillus sp. 54212]|uniref:hypothetical protein n=1 Tax=Lysinibacillus sp. 54212 TaxID=3119829 RepID=UPI002FC8235A
MKRKKWVSNEVLNWYSYSDSARILDKDKGERAYAIWEHSKQLIENNESDFHLADGITNLKRALNHRLNTIEEIYCFKAIKIKNKPKGYMEMLEILGIVRPFLMKQLLVIRNDIEHRDNKPPSKERCLELLDVIWYFLKSTDFIVQIERYNIVFDEDKERDDSSWFTLEYIYQKDIFIIRGKIPPEFVYEEPLENTFGVVLGLIDGVDDRWVSKVYSKEPIDLLPNEIIGEAKFEDSNKVSLIQDILFNY